MLKDFVKIFELFNEVYEVNKMNIAERILIRQKKDIINDIAIHLSSIIKSIIILVVNIILIQFPNYVSIGFFWIYLLVGIIFMLCHPRGIKAFFFLIKKFFSDFYKLIKGSINEHKKFFIEIYEICLEYNIWIKILVWSIIILILPIFLAINILIIVAFLITYALIFIIITIFNNGALSLIITHSIGRLIIIPLNNEIITYPYYVISFVIIYYIVDYSIRITSSILVVNSIIEQGQEKVLGLNLINTNGQISIFIKDKLFYVLDNNNNKLTIYEVHSRFKKMEEEIIFWFKKRQAKQLLNKDQPLSIENNNQNNDII